MLCWVIPVNSLGGAPLLFGVVINPVSHKAVRPGSQQRVIKHLRQSGCDVRPFGRTAGGDVEIIEWGWSRVCVRSSVASVLFHPRAAVVEQANPRPAVPISHSADCDSGLLQHLVQCRLLNGCWRDALLVCQELQLPVRTTEKRLSTWTTESSTVVG